MRDARPDVAQENSQQTEWIEIVEPKSKQRMFANLITGECAWEPPLNVYVKKTKGNQWWELYDSNNTCRYYYYNPTTTETVWQRPFNCDIIPLAKLQLLKENTECTSSARSKVPNKVGNICPQCYPRHGEQCGDSTNYSQFCNEINAALPNISRNNHSCHPQEALITEEHSNMAAFNENFNEIGGQADLARLLRNRDKQRNPSASFTYRKAQTSRSRPNPKESRSLQNASTVSELPSTIVAGHRSSAFCKGFRSYSPSSSLSSFGNHSTDMLSAGSNPPEVHDSSRSNTCEFMCSTSAHQHQPNMTSAAGWAASAAAVGRRRCELRDASISSASSSVRTPYISASNSDTISNNTSVSSVIPAPESVIASTETWTKNSLKAQLNTELNDKKLRKHALTLFKQVQSYMGDRKSKFSSDQLALSVVECCTAAAADCGASNENAYALVDEVFLQLLKQLVNNPRVDSIRRGWELLGIFLFFFAPSPNVYDQVLKFVESYSDPILDTPEFGASQYAKHCMKRLQLSRPQSTLNGSLSSNSVVAIISRPSTVEAIRQARYNIFYPSKFGTTLEELMEMQTPQFPHLKIPWIQATLIRMILESGGEKTEGLFRIASDPEQLNTALIQLEVWVKPVVKDAHVPAALLKQWLRQLPAPLIPSDLYKQCLAATSMPKTVAESCCQLIDSLPEINRLVLAALTQLLQRLCRNDETVRHTKMDVANLAMVMAPNVLRCESTDPAVIFANSRKEMEFMKTVILHYDTSAYTFDSLCI